MFFEQPKEPPSTPRAHLLAISDVLRRLGREQAGEPTPVPDSVLNDNYRVPTATGQLFVRIHRKGRPRERIEREQAAARWAGERGIPVPQPLADAEGGTLWSSGGRLVSAYPFVAGRSLQRGAIDHAGAEVLGALQGQLHSTLRDFPTERLEASSELTWDTEASIALLSRVDDLIRYYPAPGENALRIQRSLRERLAILESDEPRPPSDFDLPRQATHGDFHERNVLLGEANEVVAVVDWERVSLAPRVFELLRAVSFMRLWEEPALLDVYLRGYGRHVRLEPSVCEIGVEMWWHHDLHNTWALRETFIEGDRRIARFLDENAARLAAFREPAFRRSLVAALQRAAGSD